MKISNHQALTWCALWWLVKCRSNTPYMEWNIVINTSKTSCCYFPSTWPPKPATVASKMVPTVFKMFKVYSIVPAPSKGSLTVQKKGVKSPSLRVELAHLWSGLGFVYSLDWALKRKVSSRLYVFCPTHLSVWKKTGRGQRPGPQGLKRKLGKEDSLGSRWAKPEPIRTYGCRKPLKMAEKMHG